MLPTSSIPAAREALGELFILGFSGPELSEETSAFITQAGIGGVLINALNFESPAQLAELSNQIQECRKKSAYPLWVAVSHEGGRPQRFKKHFTKIPEAAAIAAMNSPKLAFEIAEVVAKELKAAGINLNLSPVADIATNPRNPLIGARAYGANEETVSKMISGVVRGHLLHGIQPCVKHFPGHGDTSTDSNFALPKIETPLEVLRERELKPFSKAFKSRCPAVMTAHVTFTKVDPQYPATLSHTILTEVLRNEMRFSGLVISDEMEMKAITENFSAEDAPRMALEAGCDVLLYRTEAAARHAYASLLKSLDEGKLKPSRVLEAAARSHTLKKESLLPYQPANVAGVGKVIGAPEHAAVVQKVATP